MEVAIIQMDISRDKRENLVKAENLIREASHKAKLMVLPEMFNCPYNAKTFHKYAETYPGETTERLSALAKELGVIIVGGSIPELGEEGMYNTSYVFSESGKLIGKHRKTHLFDVDIKDGITFKESDTLKAGSAATVIDIGPFKLGLGICYDMRFPEFIRTMVNQGAQAVIIPAAFNTVTGPAHWHITARARAVDNQVYFLVASPARSTYLSYKAYGHSLVVDPWGHIDREAGEGEEIIYATIDLDKIKKIRSELPLLKHRKRDCYS